MVVLPEPTTYHLRPGTFSLFLWSNSVVKLPALLTALCLLPGCAQQAAQQPPPPPPKPPLELLGQWGNHGKGPGQLSDPVSIATDSVGNVYITDLGSDFVHKFDPAGRPLLSFQDPRMRSPGSIAVDHGGVIHVYDYERDSILIFLPDGKRIGEILLRAGMRPKWPCELALDEEGKIYVADHGTSRMWVFDSRRRLVGRWRIRPPSEGPLFEGQGLRGVHLARDGSIYVGDGVEDKVLTFTGNGELLGSVQVGPTEQRGHVAWHFAFSPRAFIVTRGRDTIELWGHDGTRRYSYTIREPQLSPLSPPPPPPVPPLPGLSRLDSIAVGTSDTLFVLDSGYPRVLRFRINF